MSVRPPVLFLFISRRVLCLNLVLCCPFDRLQLFAVRASVISVSRVFGCYKCLAVCSAVSLAVGRVFGCYKRWPCVRLCWSVSVFLFSSCFYLYAFLPVSGFAHSFYLSRLLFLVGPSVLFMHVFSHAHIFSRSFCFRDFCFLLFPSYSRGLFLPRGAFVLFSCSRGFSFLFYAMRFSFTSP